MADLTLSGSTPPVNTNVQGVSGGGTGVLPAPSGGAITPDTGTGGGVTQGSSPYDEKGNPWASLLPALQSGSGAPPTATVQGLLPTLQQGAPGLMSAGMTPETLGQLFQILLLGQPGPGGTWVDNWGTPPTDTPTWVDNWTRGPMPAPAPSTPTPEAEPAPNFQPPFGSALL